VTLKLGGITGTDSAAAWWIDPRTGDRTRIGTFSTAENHIVAPPAGWEDALLLLER
jgi:hypothetical protein